MNSNFKYRIEFNGVDQFELITEELYNLGYCFYSDYSTYVVKLDTISIPKYVHDLIMNFSYNQILIVPNYNRMQISSVNYQIPEIPFMGIFTEEIREELIANTISL